MMKADISPMQRTSIMAATVACSPGAALFRYEAGDPFGSPVEREMAAQAACGRYTGLNCHAASR